MDCLLDSVKKAVPSSRAKLTTSLERSIIIEQDLEIERLQAQLADMATQLRVKTDLAEHCLSYLKEVVSGSYLDRNPQEKVRIEAAIAFAEAK